MGMRYFTVHAHFYQPHRNDPFTGIINEKTSNSCYESFNQMITDECYGPLSVKDIKFNTNEFLQSYSFINFNFGPTLLNYIKTNYPKLYISIIEADIISSKLFGYGNAIAQVYNHSILPNLTASRKKLYIKWGIENFRSNFKREPLGMWLSETACDDDTLESLIENNILFTVLSPTQIKCVKTRDGAIKDNNFDTSIPYIWRSKINPEKSIRIFFYNKDVSDRMVSELGNTEKFLLRIKSTFRENLKSDSFFLMASDGENYGHHIKDGDIFLKNLIKKIRSDKKLEITNLSYIYNSIKTTDEVEIINPSSWSCPHGTKRWNDECGCRINSNFKYQGWRKTLRRTTDELAKKSNDIFLKETTKLIKEPDKALYDYINFYDQPDPHSFIRFIEKHSKSPVTSQKASEILNIFLSQVHTAYSETSCGWFFDDITNIETLNNIKHMIWLDNLFKKYGTSTNAIEELKKEKSNLKIDVSELINNIYKNEISSEMIMAAEFAILESLDFTDRISKTKYRIKLTKKEEGNGIRAYLLKFTDIYTLQEDYFTVSIKYENNINSMVKPTSDPQRDISDMLSGNFDGCNVFNINDISKKTARLISILLSKDEKDLLLKQYLYMLSSYDHTDDSFKKLVKKFKDIASNKTDLSFIPFVYDIVSFIIRKEPDMDDEILKIIKNSNLNKILWKYQTEYDNKKF